MKTLLSKDFFRFSTILKILFNESTEKMRYRGTRRRLCCVPTVSQKNEKISQ